MIIAVFAIICATILGVAYMYYCSENGEGMFASWKLEDRVEKLEKEIKELKEK